MKFAVLQFPGSNCDQDCLHVIRNVLGYPASYLWHKEKAIRSVDAVIVPGGFSYGDYLRCGAIAKCSPVMSALKEFADNGGLVLGICNGFQILTESGLLPGALVRNRDLRFICEHVYLKPENLQSPFNKAIFEGELIHCPIAHGEGCYYIDEPGLEQLENNNQILWRYCDSFGQISSSTNPNGSISNIAGVSNIAGNVAGLMPHPERASEDILGESTGKKIFESMIRSFEDACNLKA